MEVIRPRFSISGWLTSIALVIILVFLLQLAIRTLHSGQSSFFGIFILSIILGASIFFLLIYPTMRYELRTDALWLICGPFHWKIPYSEIKEIIKTDLRYHPTSTGWKLPGYTIGKVYYADRGNVRMCATGMCKNIILIKTDEGLFGLTPRDETRFILSLKARLR
jgi:hypothetical protein